SSLWPRAWTSIRRNHVCWRRAIGDGNRFANSQLKNPRLKARRGSIDRDLGHSAAGNDDRLRALSDRVEPSAHRAGAAPSLVGQVTTGVPGIGYNSHGIVPRVVDYRRVGTHWRRRVIAVLRKGVAGNEPVFGAALHADGAPCLIVQDFVSGDYDSLGA